MSNVVKLNTGYTKAKEIHEYPPILQAKHIGEILGICTATAYDIMHSEGCPTLKLGKRLVVPRDRFWEFIMGQAGKQLW